jgi:hypothetical protein
MTKLKITLISILASAVMTVSSYSMEFKIGLSAGFAAIEAGGTETLKDTSVVTSHTEQANAVIPSIFIEVAMDNGFGIGLDSVTGSADLAGSAHTRTNVADLAPDDAGTQSAQAEVKSIRTAYLIKQFQNGLLVKFGSATADVNTLETLATGTAYGNVSVDGTHAGIGYQTISDNGLFFRATVENTNFDTISLTGSQVGGTSGSFNVIKADVDVQMAKFSIGKSF